MPRFGRAGAAGGGGRTCASRCLRTAGTSPPRRQSVKRSAASCTLAFATTHATISRSCSSHACSRFLFSNSHTAFRAASLSPALWSSSSFAPSMP